LHIRTFEAGDRQAVLDLWRLSELGPATPEAGNHIDRALDQDNCTLLVGTASSAIVATVMAGHVGHRGWIHYLAVRPASRGLGLGGEMMRAAEEWLGVKQISQIYLMVRPDNVGVLAFYEKLGWQNSTNVVLQKYNR
jgi:ribosomal protein S18 acetylase RimI-like enzyme